MNQKTEVTFLYEISKVLGEDLELKQSLYKVLRVMSKAMLLEHGTVCLRDPVKNEIVIEVAYGLSENAVRRGRYKIGEGITGRVIATGKAVTIPKVSEEPLYLDRTASWQNSDKAEASFICVPVKRGNSVIGTLGADRIYDDTFSLDTGRRLLSIVATMIAMHVFNLETIRTESKRLRQENRRLQAELENKYRVQNIVGNSNKMREVYQMISQVCQSNTNVLIRGESGTGKELVANSLHYNSGRAQNPFVKVNCAALPASLIESELFGHEKGAFTGAIRRKIGKFELANKGTIFLDEIGSIDANVQAALLRVIQAREFERVGGDKTIRTDARVLAATNKNLENAVESGTFREDLYYRLNVFPIFIPPLRERKTDIFLLADYFLEKYAKENGKSIRRFSTSAINMLSDYHWPGNVRELENVIERATLLCMDGVIHAQHLPPTLQTGTASNTLPSLSLEGAVENLERDMIIDALKNTGGHVTRAAALLKTTMRKFAYKSKKYGIRFQDYRN